MPRPSSKKRDSASGPPEDASTKPPEPPPRRGLPARKSVTSVSEFKSPKSPEKTYRILKTIETDAYDQPARRKGKRRPSR